MSELKSQILEFGKRARAAARVLARLDSATKNAGLLAMADEIVRAKDEILSANARDVEQGTASGLGKPMIERLTLDDKKLAAMAQGIREVAALPDPSVFLSASG